MCDEPIIAVDGSAVKQSCRRGGKPASIVLASSDKDHSIIQVTHEHVASIGWPSYSGNVG